MLHQAKLVFLHTGIGKRACGNRPGSDGNRLGAGESSIGLTGALALCATIRGRCSPLHRRHVRPVSWIPRRESAAAKHEGPPPNTMLADGGHSTRLNFRNTGGEYSVQSCRTSTRSMGSASWIFAAQLIILTMTLDRTARALTWSRPSLLPRTNVFGYEAASMTGYKGGKAPWITVAGRSEPRG